jgi:hypothetical protein
VASCGDGGRRSSGCDASLSGGRESTTTCTTRLLPWRIWMRTTDVHGAPAATASTCPWPCSQAAAGGAPRLLPLQIQQQHSREQPQGGG